MLVLLVAQLAVGRAHALVPASTPAHAAATSMPDGHCQHGRDMQMPGGTSHSKAPMPPCGSCPGSMPGQPGGCCLDMASCGPGQMAPSAPLLTALADEDMREAPPVISSPATHELIPDPPPPRA